MKIAVQTPLKNNEIRLLLDGAEKDGVYFSFEEKKGISLVFEAEGANASAACGIAKKMIKDTDWGKVLYFSVQEL